jgi:hypothetical protein
MMDELPATADLIAAYPYGAVVCQRPEQRAASMLWTIEKGEALPLPAHILDRAREAFARGDGVLIMAVVEEDRDAARDALMLALAGAHGAA